MPNNQIKPFATANGANTLDPATYASRTAVQSGFVDGVADPKEANTALRQSSTVAAALAQFVVNATSSDVNDNGDVSGLAGQIAQAVETFVPSVPAAVVHIGQDSSSAASAIVSDVSPSITSYPLGHVYIVQAAHACPGATTANFDGQGAQAIVHNDASTPVSNDWAAGEYLILADTGSTFQLTRLTNSQVLALVTTGITNNITNIAPMVFNAEQTVTSFTPVVVLSDLPYNVQTVVKSIAIPAGTSFVQGFGQLAYRNDSTTSRISFITSLRLTGSDSSSVDSPYIGGGMQPAGSTGGTQSAQPVNHAFRNLNKTVTYTLNLMGFKIDNASPLVVLDGYIEGNYA